MKIRNFPERNYKAIFSSKHKTIRLKYDQSKDIEPLEYPEIEDISLGNMCYANCPWCYTSAITNGNLYPDVVDKIQDYYGNLESEKRPFQVAFGGEGEPTMHPEFPAILEKMSDLGILPNYTTNGMHITEELLAVTKKHCGGVAVSCHPHIEKIWKNALTKYTEYGIDTCLHIIVGGKGSSDNFWNIVNYTKDKNIEVKYFVILPLQLAGRAEIPDETERNLKNQEIIEEWDKLFNSLYSVSLTNLAFGALFYEYFLENKELIQNLNISIYEPEVLSGYRIMNDSYKLLRKSSYDLRPKIEEKP